MERLFPPHTCNDGQVGYQGNEEHGIEEYQNPNVHSSGITVTKDV
jgi:hypothetical protein